MIEAMKLAINNVTIHTTTNPPHTLASQYEKPSKPDAITQHMSRFN